MSSYGPTPYYAAPRPGGPHRTAAVLLWVVAGLDIVLFGCCSCFAAAIGLMPESAIQDAAAQSQMPAEQLDQIMAIRPAAVAGAVFIVLAMVLPGLALAVLAFFVRNGAKPAVITSIVLVCIQLGFIGLSMLGNLTQPVAFVMGLLIYGPFGALLVFAVIKLTAVLRAGATAKPRSTETAYQAPPSDEPWNDHLG